MPSLLRPRAVRTLGQCQEDDTVRPLCTRTAEARQMFCFRRRRGQSRSGERGPVAIGRPPPLAIDSWPTQLASARPLAASATSWSKHMRSFRNLWPQVVWWNNLLQAYHKCRRRKRFKRDATEFDFRWESNLLDLQRALVEGRYQPGPYRHFYIIDPKRRKISAAPFRDRVVHHAVVRVLEPLYERRFIYDSYACRLGKGTHRALDRAQGYLRRYPYFLKTDIVRFFPNVDHEILLRLLSRHIQDPRLMDLVTRIINSGDGVLREEATPSYFPGDDLLAVLRPTGLPIGNLTSQFFANVLLDGIDHFIKEELHIGGYVRYADDLVLFGDDKAQLWQIRDALQLRLTQLRLRLHEHKTQVHPSTSDLKFLGFALKRDGCRLPQSSIQRFRRRVRLLRYQFARRECDCATIQASLQAWQAHACRANSAGLFRDLWRNLRFSRRRSSTSESVGRARRLHSVANRTAPE